MSKPITKQSWEKDFWKLMDEGRLDWGHKMHDFIRDLLAQKEHDHKILVNTILSTEKQKREQLIKELEEWVNIYKCDFNWNFEKNKPKHKSYFALDDLLTKLTEMRKA